MPPKKDAKKKPKKGTKPPWMSDEVFELSVNLPKLTELYAGDLGKDGKKDAKGAGKDGKVVLPLINRPQAGLFIWQLLFPPNKAGKERRDEAVKLALTEISVKVFASGKGAELQTPAAGILTAMVSDNDQQRALMLDAKPSILPHLLTALSSDRASLKAGVCALLRVLATHDDSRLRLWRVLRDWDWTPLLAALELQVVSQLGGRHAAHDACVAIDSLCGAPEADMSAAACAAVTSCGGLAQLVQVLTSRISHPLAKGAAVSIFNRVMTRGSLQTCEEICEQLGGLEPIIAVFGHPVIPLMNKAHAAACLLRFVMPDSLWKDSSALRGQPGKPTTATAGSLAAAVMPSIADPTLIFDFSPPATPAVADRADGMRMAAAAALESHSDQVPDIDLLDDETRAEVLRRARVVAAFPSAIPELVKLCIGPEGPLPDLESVSDTLDLAVAAEAEAVAAAAEAGDGEGAAAAAAAVTAAAEATAAARAALAAAAAGPGKGGKAGGKKGKKGKKAKLEPGMAEAQTFASAVLRLVSLGDDLRGPLMSCGALRYILPLLDSKVSAARWNARQTLINLSMSPGLLNTLTLYKVPEYIHMANVPAHHYERPVSPGPGDSENSAGAILGEAMQRLSTPSGAPGTGRNATSARNKPNMLRAAALKVDGGGGMPSAHAKVEAAAPVAIAAA